MGKRENFFTDSKSIKTIDRLRTTYLGLSILFFFLTEFGRNVYRPFIYSHDIDDFGIADSIGNSGGIIVQIFFTLAVLNSQGRKALHVIGFIAIGYVIYEILQPYLPRGVFDWKDIYGTFIGAAVSLLLWLMLQKIVHNKVIYVFK